MSNVPLFVGLDYHQDSIQVCVLNQKGDVLLNRSVANDSHELGTGLGTFKISSENANLERRLPWIG